MPSKILIANRGEIALRIIRACREMGYKSVLAFSEADRDSLPVMLADEAVCIGPGPALDSYLKVDRLIAVAELTGADAIHPGYGFLSENAHFAEICEECKLTFIGPSASAIARMGNKNVARRLMSQAGIPVVPGSDGAVLTLGEARKWASTVGYPVMVKAAAGGGGRGMRRVANESELDGAFHSAQREARQAFASDELFIEKLIDNPKHVEIQILADHFGNVVHFGERDCSMQRRNQKMIEESPCLKLDEKQRYAMGKAAIKAAKAAEYTGVGTVEFLLDKKGHFYFMEMNTRIQVEHPVTEMVTGRDLLKEQIRIAFGGKIRYSQKDILSRGHAIEVRVNAEDVQHKFTPCPGVVSFYSAPGGPGIRVDSHLYSGASVPPYYDSLLAKIIAYGDNRQEALARIRRALGELSIEGVLTTNKFAQHLLSLPEFVDGTYTTRTIEKELDSLEPEALAQFTDLNFANIIMENKK